MGRYWCLRPASTVRTTHLTIWTKLIRPDSESQLSTQMPTTTKWPIPLKPNNTKTTLKSQLGQTWSTQSQMVKFHKPTESTQSSQPNRVNPVKLTQNWLKHASTWGLLRRYAQHMHASYWLHYGDVNRVCGAYSLLHGAYPRRAQTLIKWLKA